MIPIINSDVEVERVSIYNKDVLDSHPLNGARLTNTTGNHLLQGPITVFDGGAYAGDARIDDLPPGQERLLSYAIDLDVDVTATSDASGGLLQSGKIVKGVLEIKKKFVHTQKYALTNNADRDRRVIIEHKFRPGWKLVDRAKPKKTTDTHYRFKKTVRAGKSAKFIVTEEFVQQETIAILSGNISGLLVFHQAGEIPKKVREALAEAISRKQALEEIATQITQQREGLSAIDKEQKRIRSNMNTVSKNTAYYNRLLKKLDDQETHIEDIQADLRLLEKERDKQRRDLEEYLADLTVG